MGIKPPNKKKKKKITLEAFFNTHLFAVTQGQARNRVIGTSLASCHPILGKTTAGSTCGGPGWTESMDGVVQCCVGLWRNRWCLWRELSLSWLVRTDICLWFAAADVKLNGCHVLWTLGSSRSHVHSVLSPLQAFFLYTPPYRPTKGLWG